MYAFSVSLILSVCFAFFSVAASVFVVWLFRYSAAIVGVRLLLFCVCVFL